jgi:hypothetical protein
MVRTTPRRSAGSRGERGGEDGVLLGLGEFACQGDGRAEDDADRGGAGTASRLTDLRARYRWLELGHTLHDQGINGRQVSRP